MMYIQTRRRKLKFPFSSFGSHSFLLFSLHFPLNLNCRPNWIRKEPTHSEDSDSGASSSSTTLHGGEYKGGDEQRKGNDYEVFLSTSQSNPLEMERKKPTHIEDSVHGASSSSTSPHTGDYGGGTKKSKGIGYEVFLNFRGLDIRKGFADYLYTSLVDAGVHVCRNEGIHVDEEIAPDVFYNITRSKISIPIFSENYASNTWCLRELFQILDCKRSRGQIVLPIYYNVEPSQVKYHTGRFGDAINAHQRNLDKVIVEKWKEALYEIGSLKGWESKKFADGNEGALVKSVVKQVIRELNGSTKTMSLVDDDEVGINKLKGNECEVFLSFKRKDTCKGFADYLYTILVDAGIHVFMEDDDLRDGEQTGLEHLSSIMQSKISIPIISENYASCQSCLRELTLMLKCKRSRRQKVFPIFYKLDPWEVRRLKGRYGHAINKWKKNMGEMVVDEWKEALKEVCYLRGWESERTENGHEGALAKIVVEKVRSELNGTFKQIVLEELMGVDERAEQIMSLIDPKFNDTRIVGIWGKDGIGKTTVARVLYNKLSSHFKHLSFVANIRETSLHKGIECLQEQLTDDIIRSPYDVSTDRNNIIKSQYKDKKVLILLDDIDAITDFNALVGDVSWFKAGSIVIITTNNKRILDQAKVDYKYELNKLSSNESLILFSRHAFQKDYPDKDYEIISHNVVSVVGRLPLALKVIGSYLHGKSKGVWNDILKKLMEVPHQKVQETLRISYEELDDGEQQIFLDIACFFIGSSKQSPTYMWEAYGFSPKDGIEVLSRMSLIKIDKDGKLMMHNQLRDLGREIVRLKSPKEPQEHSRLWNYEEVVDVLDNNKGSSKIEALCLDKCGYKRSYTSEQFKELDNLRFLQVCGANFTGDFQNLLPQLKWLQWECCPSDFTMANFHPKSLAVLNLLRSEISEEWRGWGSFEMATQLKVLNLTGCLSLRSIPDLSAFESLEILILEECENLEMIHPSIGDIETLISLNVRRCGRVKELPTAVGTMTKLRELLIRETAIQEIPILEDGLMKLETLCASWCPRLTQLPESMGSLESLTQLDLSHSEIETLPESISSLVSLTQLDLSYSYIEELPHSMGSLTSLTQLDLSHSGIREFPESMGFLVSLTQLDLSDSGIEKLPESIGFLKKLKTLNASNCALLAHIHSSIGHLASLSLLDLRKCHKLAQLPNSIGSLVSLQRLLLRGCRSLGEIPDSIGQLVSLTELDLKSTAIAELPQSIEKLQNLRILDIRGTHITELPGAFSTPRIFKH